MPNLAILVGLLVAASVVTPPAELLPPDVPRGFELAVDPASELTFDEYADLSPDAVAHVAADSVEAAAMRAAVDVWTSVTDDVLIREVTLWTSEDAARDYVTQAATVGASNGLSAGDAPFDGGVAFVGDEGGLRTRSLAWRQGPYAIAVSHFAVQQSGAEVIDEAAQAVADEVDAATGHAVGAIEQPDALATPDDGGIPLGSVLLWLVVVAGGVWLILKIKRRRAEATDRSERGDDDNTDEDATDVDDLIERARARGRAQREVDAIPDPTGDDRLSDDV